VVFNKADLLEDVETNALLRQTSIEKQIECVAVSALKPETIRPLLEKIGEKLMRDLGESENSALTDEQKVEEYSEFNLSQYSH
jgi:50S ribosomal subunit-associated GTPase HflX